MTSDVRIRPATEADLPAAFAVTWRCDQGIDAEVPTERGRLRYLEHELATGRVAVADAAGDVIGIGACIERGGVSLLADLFVDPRRHGGGIGARLMDEVLGGRWPRQTFASLHPNALPLYARVGMLPLWPVLYLRGDPGALPAGDGFSAVGGVESDELAELERSWGGVSRPEDHRYWAGAPRAVSIMIRRDRQPVGFAYLAFEGHVEEDWWVSSMSAAPSIDPPGSLAALAAVLRLAADRRIRTLGVTVPGPHPATVPLLRAGWRIEDQDVYMASERGLLDPERRIPDPTFG